MRTSFCFVWLNICLLLLITGCSKEEDTSKKDVSELTPDENKKRLEQIGTQLLLKINPIEQKELLETIDAFVDLGGKEHLRNTGYAYALHQYNAETGWDCEEGHDCLEYRYPVGKKNANLTVTYSDERCTVYGREIPKEMHSVIQLNSKKICTSDLILQEDHSTGDVTVTGTIKASQCTFHLSANLSELTTSTFSLWLESGKEKLLTMSGTATVGSSHLLEEGVMQLNVLERVVFDFSAEKLSEMREKVRVAEGVAGSQEYCQKVASIYNQYIKGSYHYTESDYIIANIGFQPYAHSEFDEKWGVESVMCFMYDQSKYSLDSYLGINLASWITKVCGISIYL